ncbi:hypothetical protein FHT76_006929 [Rhizobium sp. BK176]|nr:hypothetical protein [Rhizobium sp. BK176]
MSAPEEVETTATAFSWSRTRRQKVTPVAVELEKRGIPFVLATASAAHELAPFPILATALNVGKPTD